jgi:hypothetical protein
VPRLITAEWAHFSRTALEVRPAEDNKMLAAAQPPVRDLPRLCPVIDKIVSGDVLVHGEIAATLHVVEVASFTGHRLASSGCLNRGVS